jgi:hypothetical protein
MTARLIEAGVEPKAIIEAFEKDAAEAKSK